MSRSDNKLSIRTRDLDLELEGEAPEVRRAYRALRSQLVEQFYQTMVARRGPGDRTLELPTIGRVDEATADSLAEPTLVDEKDGKRVVSKQGDDHFINLVVCEGIYNKMYLLDQKHFQKSFLNKVLRGAQIRRLYVDAGVEKRLRDGVELGSTLWRELTAEGKAVVGRSD